MHAHQTGPPTSHPLTWKYPDWNCVRILITKVMRNSIVRNEKIFEESRVMNQLSKQSNFFFSNTDSVSNATEFQFKTITKATPTLSISVFMQY